MKRPFDFPILRLGPRLLDRLANLPYVNVDLLGKIVGIWGVALMVGIVADSHLGGHFREILFAASIPLLVVFGAFMLYCFLVQLPLEAFYALYSYLRERQIPHQAR